MFPPRRTQLSCPPLHALTRLTDYLLLQFPSPPPPRKSTTMPFDPL